jgi:hypothetical protein
MLDSAEYVVKYFVPIPQFIFSLVRELMRTSNNRSKLNEPEKLQMKPMGESTVTVVRLYRVRNVATEPPSFCIALYLRAYIFPS